MSRNGLGKHVFLSHASTDRDVAGGIQELIERVSLTKVKVWFSSDAKPTGGIVPGNWQEQIEKNLRDAKLVIALLTPESLNLPWIAFECGFGAAVSNDKVIPVSLGLDINGGIPKPLSMFTVYQLTDIGSVNAFLARVLQEFDIKYDSEMAAYYVKPTVQKFSNLLDAKQNKAASSPNASERELVREIKSYFDQALSNYSKVAKPANAEQTYTVPIRYSFPRLQADDYLPIRPGDTVADKMVEVFQRISGQVKAYSYLVEWIIRDITNEVNLVVREIQERIPASSVFQQGSQWEVMPLKEPYSGRDGWSEPWGEPKKIERRTQKPPTPPPWEPGDSSEDTKDRLKRMRKVDPIHSKRYRQRTGE